MPESAPTERPFRGIARDLAAYGLLSGLTRMSGLLLLPVLTRALSVEDYGSVDVVATWVAFLSVLLQLAMPGAVGRFLLAPGTERAPLVSTALATVAAGAALAWLLTAPLAGALASLLLEGPHDAGLVRLGTGVAALASVGAVAQTVLRMERRILAFNALELVHVSVYVGLALFLVVEREAGVRGVFQAQLAAHGLVLALALAALRGLLTPHLSREALLRLLRFGGPMLPGRVVLWLNAQADRLLLLAFVGLSGVALLGVPARLATGFQFLLLVFRQAWQPHAMRLLDAPGGDEVFRRMLRYFGGGTAVLALGLTALAPELFGLLAPEAYRPGLVALPWLLGAAILHHSATITNVGMMAAGRTGGITRASLWSAGVNLALAGALIPSFGIAGAAIGSFAAELAFTAFCLRRSQELRPLRFDVGVAAATLAIYVVASAGLLAAQHALDGGASLALRLGLAAAASALLLWRSADASAWRALAAVAARDSSR